MWEGGSSPAIPRLGAERAPVLAAGHGAGEPHLSLSGQGSYSSSFPPCWTQALKPPCEWTGVQPQNKALQGCPFTPLKRMHPMGQTGGAARQVSLCSRGGAPAMESLETALKPYLTLPYLVLPPCNIIIPPCTIITPG